MSIDFSFTVDPAAVLGVSREATLQEIRDAYRAKAKRYHPDAGGEEWAFRVIAQSYEVMSTARVARATAREDSYVRRPSPPPPPPPQEPPLRPRSAGDDWTNETVRPGPRDQVDDPSRLVDVERLTIRHQADQVWLITDRSSSQYFLSCCLNVTWPDPDLKVVPSTIDGAEGVLRDLDGILETLCLKSRALSSRATVVDGRFAGWVSYPNVERASAAFARLRDLLHAKGLGVKQWSRDLIIPRQWR